MNNLTKSFKLEEFTVSSSYPDFMRGKVLSQVDKTKMFYLCRLFLEPIREHFRTPITILSGLRTAELNQKVGGEANSDHLYSYGMSKLQDLGVNEKAAVDFTVADPSKLEEIYRFLKLRGPYAFGQLIYYPTKKFIHCSLPSAEHCGEAWINEEKVRQ